MKPPRSIVLVIEPDFTGHRWRYAQWAAQAYADEGMRSIIATVPGNESHPLARAIVDGKYPGLAIAFVAPPPRERSFVAQLERLSYARHHRYFAHAYRQIAAHTTIALVVSPYVDYFLYALPFLGSPFRDTPWIGITMRATFHHRSVGIEAPRRPIVNAVKARLFRCAIGTPGLLTLLSIDPTLPEWSDRALPAKGYKTRAPAPIAYLADPCPEAQADDPLAACARLRFGQGPHLLVYGSITERKGIRELVIALEQMARPPTLVVAGEQDERTRAFLRAHANKLKPEPIVIDRFIANELECDLFCACDAVWLGYKGHYGMSGVLVQAYRFGKRVVATSEGLIGWFCADGTFGPVLDGLSPEAIAGGIDEALAQAARVGECTSAGTHGALLERNTLDAFKRTLREAATAGASSPRSDA